MICHYDKCRENIDVGEPMVHEPVNGSGHNWFFHPGCYAKYKDERVQAANRIENVARMARQVH